MDDLVEVIKIEAHERVYKMFTKVPSFFLKKPFFPILLLVSMLIAVVTTMRYSKEIIKKS